MAHERMKTVHADVKIVGGMYLARCSTVREREFQNKESTNYTFTSVLFRSEFEGFVHLVILMLILFALPLVGY